MNDLKQLLFPNVWKGDKMSKNFGGEDDFSLIRQLDFSNESLKDIITRQYVRYMFNRTNNIFHYEGLPNTIPARNLELYLQMNGLTGIAKVNGNLYALIGGFGGEPNAYYEPTIYTVANPYLNYNAMLKNEKDCVVIYNDSTRFGLRDLNILYASLLAENKITMRLADINLRSMFLISAPDDRTKKSADAFIENLEKGKMSTVGESQFFDGVKVNPTQSSYSNTLTDLIEYEQYLKASWFNDLGLDANYNMKRESLNSSESQMNDDALIPLIEDMLMQRQTGIEKVNEMFGTEISVELNSIWKKNQQLIVEGLPEESEESETAPEENEPEEPTEENEPEEPTEKPTEEPETEEPDTIIEDLKESIEELTDAIEEITDAIEEPEEGENNESE